jgi:predicted permease
MAASDAGPVDSPLDTGSSFEWIKVTRVTDGYLKTLGVDPALGREFTTDEARSGGPQAILLGDALWRRMFGASPDVLGSTVTVGQNRYTVVGVLPRGFWMDPAADALISLQPSGTLSDNGTNSIMIARLKLGVPLEQTAAENRDLLRRFLARGAVDAPDYHGLMSVSYARFLNEGVRRNLLLLAGAAGLLLLIACANLAGLLLARMAARAKEFAVRLALGGSTLRLLWQSLLENLVLSAAGAVAGLLVASWLIAGLVALKPYTLHTAEAIGLDRPVLWFTLAIAVATCLLFSVAPLLSASRTEISGSLKAVRAAGSGRHTARGFLVTGQVAFTVMLLICAALFIQTLYRVHQQDLGFSPQGLITFFTPSSPAQQHDPAQLRRFENDMLARLKSLPGVRSAAGANALPLVGFNNFPTEREGHPDQTIGAMEIRRVSPEYFETMGIRLLRGRAITADDRASSTPVILVNQVLARQWWGEGDPLGDGIVIGRYKGKNLSSRESPPSRRVIGVVADTRRSDLKEPPRATVYIPEDQSAGGPGSGAGTNWVLRGSFGPGFAQKLRQAIAEVDPRQRVDLIQTMDEVIAAKSADARFDAWLFATFAGVALLLTAAGIYGVLAFSVAQRVYEIGTRIALGASRGRVIGMILRQSIALIAVGLLIGLVAGAAAARSLGSLLFNVKPGDPFSYAAVAVLLLIAGLLAAFLPARRAASVDPMVALRSE